MYLKIPYLQVRSNSLIQYSLPETPYIRSTDDQARYTANLLNATACRGTEDGTYSGLLKQGTKKRMIKAIELLCMSAEKKTAYNPSTGKKFPYRLIFMTLTISQKTNIEAKEAHKRCLEPFLQWLRRKHNVKLYIWKAELQKRGQVHYHITFNQFINYKDVRNKWNDLQRSAGYLDDYYQKKGHYNAPSTQIKKVLRQERMAGYFIKEFTKQFQNERSVGGKVWDCSMNLKAANYFTTNNDYSAELTKAIDEKRVKAVYTDTCIIFQMINEPARTILKATDFIDYNKNMLEICRREFDQIKKTKPEKQNFMLLSSKAPPKRIDFPVIPDLFSSS